MTNEVVESMELEKVLRRFYFDKEQYFTIIDRMEASFRRGLGPDHDKYKYSPIQMLSTYLTVLPDGSESGKFYAIDLGGTNIRFLEISLMGKKLYPNSISYEVPKEVMTGSCDGLFDFLAECIEKGFKKFGVEWKGTDFLGFTFSFPCKQIALNSGILTRWTKGFHVDGVEGQDVVKLLRNACQRRSLHVKDFILINDTTGTLLCGAYEDPDSRVGIINGTGSNACYMENIKNVEKWKVDIPDKTVIINTEWGAFGENGELDEFLTPADSIIDINSINNGKQIFEKMISGMYLGELARILIEESHGQGIIFENGLPEKLTHMQSFPTSLISDSYDFVTFKKSFEELFGTKLNEKDFQVMAKICDTVSRRSAGLCAAGLATILRRLIYQNCVIAADGSMFRKHPKFTNYVDEVLRMLCPEKDFKLILVDDGSGKGAALAACIAIKELSKRTPSPMII